MTASIPPATTPPPAWIEWGRGANDIPDGAFVSVDRTTLESGTRRTGERVPFSGGWASAYAGVELLAEGRDLIRARRNLDHVKRLLAGLPPAALEYVTQVRVLAGHDPAFRRDARTASRFRNFAPVASYNPIGRQITLYGGRPYTNGTVLHEVGHALPVDVSAWKSAVRRDDADLSGRLGGRRPRARAFEHVPDADRRVRWTPRLRPGGVTPYGEESIRKGEWLEDIAESARLVLSERRFGRSFAIRADGSPLWFAQAYPERARLLEQAWSASGRAPA